MLWPYRLAYGVGFSQSSSGQEKLWGRPPWRLECRIEVLYRRYLDQEDLGQPDLVLVAVKLYY